MWQLKFDSFHLFLLSHSIWFPLDIILFVFKLTNSRVRQNIPIHSFCDIRGWSKGIRQGSSIVPSRKIRQEEGRETFRYDGIIGLAFSRLLDPISRRCKVTPAYSRLPRWLCEWPDKRTTTGRRIAGERDVQSLNLRRHPEQWNLLVCLEPRCWSRRRQRAVVSSSSEFSWTSIHVFASFDSSWNISWVELLRRFNNLMESD